MSLFDCDIYCSLTRCEIDKGEEDRTHVCLDRKLVEGQGLRIYIRMTYSF
jgi:hypothetical protein